MVGVLLALGGMIVVSTLASDGTVEVRLGDDEVRAGRTRRLAREIDDRGPYLLPDAGSGSRDIYVQHLGEDEERGWLAFSARAPGQDDRACSLRWDGRGFEDPCTGERFPSDGDGLTRYPTRVDDGEVFVDLRAVREAPG